MPSSVAMTERFAALIGIDWGDRKHSVCLLPVGYEARERFELEHRPIAIHGWAASLRKRFGGRPVAVCLETNNGPLVSALLEHDIFVVFPVNPLALARYRKAFAVSGAKDDPSDAELALDFLHRHPDRLSELCRDSVDMRTLRRLVQTRRQLVDDRTRITNRMTHQLKAYFPQALSWFRDKDTEVFAAFLERFPTLQAAQRAKRTTLETFFRRHNVRYETTIQRRIEAIAAEQPLTSDPAAIEPASLHVQILIPQLRALSAAVARFDKEIATLCSRLPDFSLFQDLPGAGPVYSSRLLVAFGEQRDRFSGADSIQKFAGIAPVTERSGNSTWVHWRYVASKFLRQTFVEWSGETVTQSSWARAFYHHHRAHGADHQATLRALAFKWIRILYRCWMDRRPYDEARYLRALQRRGSTLLGDAPQNEVST